MLDMVKGVLGFKDNMGLIIAVAGLVTGGGALTLGKKFLFMNIIMRFFPFLFVRSMKKLGAYTNKFLEKKKSKGKYTKRWEIAEFNILKGLKEFQDEIKKGKPKRKRVKKKSD